MVVTSMLPSHNPLHEISSAILALLLHTGGGEEIDILVIKISNRESPVI